MPRTVWMRCAENPFSAPAGGPRRDSRSSDEEILGPAMKRFSVQRCFGADATQTEMPCACEDCRFGSPDTDGT